MTTQLEYEGLMMLGKITAVVIPLVAIGYFVNYGRLLRFAYIATPIIVVAWTGSVFLTPISHGSLVATLAELPHPLITILSWSGGMLLLWAVTTYFYVGPLQWFDALATLQYKTIMKRRSSTGLAWVESASTRGRERRTRITRALRMVTSGDQGSNSTQRQRAYQRPQQQQRQRPPEEFMGHYAAQPTQTGPYNDIRQQQEDNFSNGKINWRPLGKKFEVSPHAYSNIFGMDNVLAEVQKSIENLLLHPKLVVEYDVSTNAGILLYGPPGTGKTELARAVARKLGVYFIAVRPSDLIGTLNGSTEQNIAALFEEARSNAPTIVFIDEIDAIGSKRGTSNMYHDQILTQLLTELDGFEKRSGVFVIAATNRLDTLDEALIRGGRFDKKIEVPLPDRQAMWNMFDTWTKVLHLAEDVYSVEVALKLEGHSGATLKSLVERLKHIEIDKRVSGKRPLITRDEVMAEIDKIIGN